MDDPIYWTPICGNQSRQDAFWSDSITWNSSTPDLTQCFQKTVLSWTPCMYLWTVCVVYIPMLICKTTVNRGVSRFNMFKTFLCGMLVLLSVIDLIIVIYHQRDYQPVLADYMKPVSYVCTYLLLSVLTYFEFRKGIHSGGFLFTFWVLIVSLNIIPFRSHILYVQANRFKSTLHEALVPTFYICFCVQVCQLLSHCFSDYNALPWTETEEKMTLFAYKQIEKPQNPCPAESVPFWQKITFLYMTKMFMDGYRRTLTGADLWNLMHGEKCQTIISNVVNCWNYEVDKINSRFDAGENKPNYNSLLPSSKTSTVKLKYFKTIHKNCLDKEEVSVTWRIMKTVFGPYYACSGLLLGVYAILGFAGPMLLNSLINFINEQNAYPWKGYFYVGLLFIISFVRSLLCQWCEYINTIIGLRVRTAVIAMVYRKALILNNKGKSRYTVGQIVNLMSVDSQKLQDATLWLHYLWDSLFTIAIAFVLLWQQLGAAVIVGFGFMLATVPLNAVIVRKTMQYQIKQMHFKDERIKIANEVLKGIKVLKLYGWEIAFRDRILVVRNKELNTLWVEGLWNAVHTSIIRITPFLLGFLSFATYTLMSEENVLDANKAFVSLSLFSIVQGVLFCIPPSYKYATQVVVSLRRINRFMLSEELDNDNVLLNDSEDDVITLENATFTWIENTEPILKNISMSIPEGKLVAIVGQVGAGKSSLVSALLGDMEVIVGKVKTRGSIAYVPQQAWITNATVQENILFGNFMNSITYKQVIDGCALNPDFQILTSGDLTEIGEHGINLSGGQKQRLSLARAVYQNSDIYLLDDPLSAVDAHVGKHIFDHVLGPNGMLNSKTRVLVTNGITFLPQTDIIVCIKDGTISEIGSYEELLDNNGAFSEFMQNYQNDIKCEEIEKMFSGKVKQCPSGDPEVLTKQSAILRHSKKTHELRKINLFEQADVDYNRKELTGVEGVTIGKIKMEVLINWFISCGLLRIVCVLIFFVMALVFTIWYSIWLSEWTNDPLTENGLQDISQRNYRLGIYGLLGIFFSHIGVAIAMALVAINASQNLHNNLMISIIRAPMAFFDTTPLGRVVNRISKDMDTLDTTIPLILRAIIGCVLNILTVFISICYSTPVFMLVMIPMSVFYILLRQVYVCTSRQIMRIDSIKRSPIYGHFSESITGASSIRAYGQVERFIAKSDELVDQNQMAYFAFMVSKRWLGFILDMLGNIVVLCAGVFAVQARDTITPGLAGLSVSYSLQVTMMLQIFTKCVSDLEGYLISLERIHEYTNCPQEAPATVEGNKPSHDWPRKGLVIFDNYSTQYRPGLDLVLKNVSCEIRPGEHVGIVGRTGAGKSSITLALFRIIESVSGKILVDGTNISAIGLQDLRTKITIIPQDPVLFSGTIRTNLDPLEKYNDGEMWQALESSYLKDYIKSLPGELYFVCGEGGENFSVGQRQLVCLARALLRRSQILVLDEATAAVDLETDDLIQATIRSEFKDSTVITIAHRLNTIMDYDRILVLNEGEIVELDTPDVLLKTKTSLFYDMAKNAGLIS